MIKIFKLLVALTVLLLSACYHVNKLETSSYNKESFISALYRYSESEENYYPGELILKDNTGEILVNSCKTYLDNLATYSVLETDENMHMLLYYLPCIANTLDKKATDSSVSFYSNELSEVIINDLNLATFQSSLRPKLTDNVTSFKDLAYEYTESENQVTIKRPTWEYNFVLLGKGDYDHDGIEDLLVLFIDSSQASSYYSNSLLVLRKKEASQFWQAIEAEELL